MLDENLPTFVLKPSSDKPKQSSTFLYSQYGADFEPLYALRHLDHEQISSKNRYAVALYDAFNPDVLFAEVLLIPEWTQPSLNAEQTRLHGGVPPPPEPILPTEFVIQLYNPDQQISVKYKPATWNSAATWEFEMPQQTFRTPSGSALDRGQHDPAASEITPKVGLKWKKDGKLSKDLACFLSGKSTNPDGSKRRNKEPDITVAIFKGLKEVTLYEPNLQRIDVEDMKGFEVALLLGAVVIRDVYFGVMKETFNFYAGGRRSSTTSPTLATASAISSAQSPPKSKPGAPIRDPRVPPTDPRSEWEIEAETARLRRQAAEEERVRRRHEEAEQKQIRKMLEAEEKEQRRKQSEIDRETERLKRVFGQTQPSTAPPVPPRNYQQRHSSDPRLSTYHEPQAQMYPYQNGWAGYPPTQPYMSGAASQSGYSGRESPQQRLKPKSSFFSFRRNSEYDDPRLQRKRSAVF